MADATASIDSSPSTIARELKRKVRGDVRADPFTRSMYSTDASIYEIEPLVVVDPLDEDDVCSCLSFANQNGIPVTARGAGTGITGECLGKGIILDLNVHMARIIELDRQNRTVVVESGVVLDSLNRALNSYGFRVGPRPGSAACCTIGGMIATNAHGRRSLKFGSTREILISARAALSDGTVTNFRPIPADGPVHDRKKREAGLAGKINRDLPALLKKNADLIRGKKNRAERDRCGYMLDDVLSHEIFDPSLLLVGSEGTLGIVSEAVIRVEPLPGGVGVALVYFDSLLDAAKAVTALRETNPSSCELMDAALMVSARKARPELSELYPEETGALLVVEYDERSEERVEERFKSLDERLKQGVTHSMVRTLQKPTTQTELWSSLKAALPTLYHRDDGRKPVPIVEDAAVPLDRLPEFIERTVKIFEKHSLEYVSHGHIGLGQPHLRPLMDLRDGEQVELLQKVAEEVHEITWDCEGSISGGFGEGLARAQFIEKQVGSERHAVNRSIKQLFDPAGIMNPGKKITDDAGLLAKHLKLGTDHCYPEDQRGRKPLLNWTEGEMARACEYENGYMLCRATGPEAEMAPRFKYNRIEDACPRGWANVIRRLLTGRQREGSFVSNELIRILDFCWNSKLIGDDSSTAPDVSKLVLESKARYYQAHELPLEQEVLMQAETWCRIGSALSPMVNTLSGLPSFRYLLQKCAGLERRRPLPRFKTWRIRHRNMYDPDGQRPKVALYVDLFTRYFAPAVAQAAVDVLEHNGYEVAVPDATWTNWPAVANGAVLQAREQAARVSGVLAPFAVQGIPILVLEPTDALCLKREFLYYLDTPETRMVARHTRDICDFLLELRESNRLKAPSSELGIRLGYHQPPHHRALRIGQPGLELVRRLPGVSVKFEDQGCSGMLVHFGLLHRHYEESMWIGRSLFKALEKADVDCGLTDSHYDAEQMRHGTGKSVYHPVQVVAAASGFGVARARDFAYEPNDRPGADAHGDNREQVKEKGASAS